MTSEEFHNQYYDMYDKKVKVTYLYDPKDTYNDIFQIYFPEYDIQISEDPDIQYIIKDKTWEYNWDEENCKYVRASDNPSWGVRCPALDGMAMASGTWWKAIL